MPRAPNPWDDVFKKQGMFFTEPPEDMPDVAGLFKKHGVRTVLDLGCGSGRHVVCLAREGFSVYGFDKSREGLDIARTWLEKEGLQADLKTGEMAGRLPYSDGFFGAVISTQVIHHAVLPDIRKITAEIKRVLTENGLIFITVPNVKNQGETYEEIEPDTFVPLNGREKGLPHHYFTEETLRAMFQDFEITDIHIDRVDHFAMSGIKRENRPGK